MPSVPLDDESHALLLRLAAARGISVEQMVKEILEQQLGALPPDDADDA